MNIYGEGLALEVTRRCNLKCEHCLRGNAQPLNMSREVIHNALRGLDYINTLTFTGGEPSLACDVLEDIYQTIVWRGIKFSSFFMVTNGKNSRNRKRLLDILWKLYDRAEEQEDCVLYVSDDQYHKYERENSNRTLLDGYEREDYCGYKYWVENPFYDPKGKSSPIYDLIDEGRAAGMGSKKASDFQEEWIIDEDGNLEEGIVYISANGNVSDNCNLSFKSIDSKALGNILKEPLQNIVERYAKKPEEECIV